MSNLARLKSKIAQDVPQCGATKVSKAPFVPFVASELVPSRQISVTMIDRDAYEERAAIRESLLNKLWYGVLIIDMLDKHCWKEH